jgi:hypothetical protein
VRVLYVIVSKMLVAADAANDVFDDVVSSLTYDARFY